MAEASHAVFLSYASQDAEVAQRICEALRAAGVEVWFDQSELRGGDAWDQSIRKQIKTCALFVPVISQHTHERAEGYFRLEWKLAVDRSHLIRANRAFLVPVAIDHTADDDENVPEKFREVQWTRLPGGQPTPAFVRRLAALLGSDESSSTPTSPGAAPVLALRPRTANRHARWFALGVTAVVVAVVGGYYAWRGRPSSVPPQSLTVTPQSPKVTGSVIPERSVAVLPFVDMSETHDQEYFSEGLSEEIIDRLVRVPDLRVPARTSSFYFKGKQVTVAEIARTLSVAHVLEGSVRKSKTRLRVTAQLVRADTGYHLWSQTFDRKITDLFKMQDDIAAAVTKELTGTLLAETSERADPAHIEAYTLLRHGRAYADRGNKADNDKAKEYYRRALALEPDYALALAWLGGAYQNDVVNDWAPRKESCEAARPWGESAVRLAPNLAEAQITRGNFFYNCTTDWAQADVHFANAVELEPHNARALRYRGAFLSVVPGRHEEAARLLQESVVLDPLRFSAREAFVTSLAQLGRVDDAEHEALLALNLDPKRPYFHALLGRISLQRGKASAAIAQCEAEPDSESRLACLAEARFALSQFAEADAALADLITQAAANGATTIAEVYAMRGNAEQTLKWLAKAFENGEGWAGSWIGDSMLGGLPDYPRYEAFIRETWKVPLPRNAGVSGH